MASIRFDRYGLYRADLNPTRGSEIAKVRPVVVISRDELNAALETVVICPLSTRLRPNWRCRLRVSCQGKPADVAVDQIRTVSKTRLVAKLGALTAVEARELRWLISEMYAAA